MKKIIILFLILVIICLSACSKSESKSGSKSDSKSKSSSSRSDEDAEDDKYDFSDIERGDYITFGTYEQDRSKEGKEPIEWLVLEVTDSEVLLLSKYALECVPYNEQFTDITWETCTLRTWLNKDFYDAAFGAHFG